jgi:protein-S-isoprenylcysteine O-methyltransferase Ste14
MMMLRAATFLAASAVLALLTRRSLGFPRSHGFYRFLAFELLLILVLLNAPDWFREPLSTRQVASWTILAASTGLAMEAFRLIFKIGRPVRNTSQGANLWFENTTMLVAVGIYRYVRHPMYASLMGLGWGAFLKHPSGIGLGLTLSASAFLVATAVAEERENLARFGPAYSAYMKSTRRFVPFVL